ncbi:saccharopine dehydrogenase [Simkania negevensis]|uniref:Saccharopine dehydrogenase n=1 Tax=Simkania negevensis TaxID=83561 RepID=A0ABS3ATU2_9BACT|nr:saccharopine dehydrogenase [Simkania negevensis]
MTRLWIRAEVKPFEKRTPLIPNHAKLLIEAGITVTIEKSKGRIYTDDDYAEAGCQLAEAQSWQDSSKETYVMGIKELPDEDFPLHHKHIYFAHVYKGQSDSKKILARFQKGEGILYDLEYLKCEKGKRVTTFGFWSGMAGAAVTLLSWCQKVKGYEGPYKVAPFYANVALLYADLKKELNDIQEKPKALIIGYKGRCGKGAAALLNDMQITPVLWGRENTGENKSFQKILDFDLLFNCVFVDHKIEPFLTSSVLENNRKLSFINDISCDPTSSFNPLPLYDSITTFDKPSVKINGGKCPIDLIAIDHLPTFLPKESSDDFSAQLFPFLLQLDGNEMEDSVWNRSEGIYRLQTSLNGKANDALMATL